MKKIFSLIIAVLLITFALTNTVMASEGSPAGSCPSDFDIHMFMDHSGEHMHKHIGLVQDINGDGFICMMVVARDLHLHVDNALPLP